MQTKFITLGLSLLGVGGVVTTSWLSVRAHEKAKKKTDKKGKILAWLPPILSGITTSACILGSHRLSRREIVMLTGTCTYAVTNRDKILKLAREKLGNEAVNDIQNEAAIETTKEINKKAEFEETGYGDVQFIEEMFGRRFLCSLEHVKWAEKTMNLMFMNGLNVNMNTFYDLIGIKKSREGWIFGWPDTGDVFGYSIDHPIYFENRAVDAENGKIAYIIDIRTTPPIKDYMEV